MADQPKERAQPSLEQSLPFERRIIELELAAEQASSEEERQDLLAELERERETVFSNLTPWQRVLLARHPLRPRMLDYTNRVLEDLLEFHGDRLCGDDPAMIGGIGRFQGESLMVIGQQKGVATEEKVRRNFGMAHPEGYRKALRLMQLAERLGLPVVSFVDTGGAHPGIEAEQHGQGPAIAYNIWASMAIKTPIFAVVIGEGGSGGALGIAVADYVAMFEHAIYVICAPERCAEILWRDVEKKELAAAALKITAQDLRDLGVIDTIIPEPPGGAHRTPGAAADAFAVELERFLADCKANRWTPERRRQKFSRMGDWLDASASS